MSRNNGNYDRIDDDDISYNDQDDNINNDDGNDSDLSVGDEGDLDIMGVGTSTSTKSTSTRNRNRHMHIEHIEDLVGKRGIEKMKTAGATAGSIVAEDRLKKPLSSGPLRNNGRSTTEFESGTSSATVPTSFLLPIATPPPPPPPPPPANSNVTDISKLRKLKFRKPKSTKPRPSTPASFIPLEPFDNPFSSTPAPAPASSFASTPTSTPAPAPGRLRSSLTEQAENNASAVSLTHSEIYGDQSNLDIGPDTSGHGDEGKPMNRRHNRRHGSAGSSTPRPSISTANVYDQIEPSTGPLKLKRFMTGIFGKMGSIGSDGRTRGSVGTVPGHRANTPSWSSVDSKSKKRNSSAGPCAIEDKEATLMNFANSSDNNVLAAAQVVAATTGAIRNFKMDQNVLVAFHIYNAVDGVQRPLHCRPVNKHGYPRGGGTTEEERKGEFLYVLAKIVGIKYSENAPYYMVRRYDTKEEQRADSDWMEPIPTEAGVVAAMAAARQMEETGDHDHGHNNSCIAAFRRKLCRFFLSITRFVHSQASKCLSGQAPYRFEMKVTTVNILVLCSIIVAFGDQMRYAWLSPACDDAVSGIIFGAWIILILELYFEVYVRPENYSALLKDERAYSPSTARYINGFHLFFETVALLFVIPDFLPLFDVNCRNVSFVGAAINLSNGRTYWQFILGHVVFVLIRMRIFGLVRYRRNHYIKRHLTIVPTNNEDNTEHKPLLHDEDSVAVSKNRDELVGGHDKDATLVRADRIGTALLLVNSHRSLLFLLVIHFIVPIIAYVATGGRNMSVHEMTKYLHRINENMPLDSLNTTSSDLNCQIFNVSYHSWLDAETYSQNCHEVKNVILKPVRKHCKITSDFNASESRKATNFTTFAKNDIVSTSVTFDMSKVVQRTATNCFLLQLSSLLLMILWLGWLRSDAKRNVIGPLRRMLKIVLRYAENPLADQKEEDERDSRGSNLLAHETSQLIRAVSNITNLLRQCWGVAGAGIISTNLASNMDGKKIVDFNPIVPGKQVYALFGFAGISDYSFILRSLEEHTMTFINAVARVVHDEVYRWGFDSSGQCNRNLGSAFLLVYRIGDFEEVAWMKQLAINIFLSMGDRSKDQKPQMIDGANDIQLATLPGISRFADRALLGILKTFAGLYRDRNLKQFWEDNDLRLSAGVKAFSFEMTFGMDAGWATEGAVGSSYKIDATYLSSHLNMASRMMCAAKQFKVPILVTEKMEELLSSSARKLMRHIDTIIVKGSSEPQRVYTYDARHRGVDFFLNGRRDDVADRESERYQENIWNRDSDLREMRAHISPEFESAFKLGLQQYHMGNFPDALKHLENANEIMVAEVINAGRMEHVNALRSLLLDPNQTREDVVTLREKIGDGPSQTLIQYIKSEDPGGAKYGPKRENQKPEGWKGYRFLSNK